MEVEVKSTDTITFRVDAGLIDRLGRELVGRAETAISELIKNAYDADATIVEVNFIDTQEIGGTLVIHDNGLGMDLQQLKNGFMTISSADKIHYPNSERYKRQRAGRKGIGRFAAHRLGRSLTIVTQTLNSPKAIKLVINWDDYKIDTNLTSIENTIEYVDKQQEEGTILTIVGLREWWSNDAITRAYRYIYDLLQPDYISDKGKSLGIGTQKDEAFKVAFKSIIDGQELIIADPQKMLFEKALAVIEAYIDNQHDGYCTASSSSLDVSDDIVIVPHNFTYKGEKESETKYRLLNDVHFKAYYFIYNREKYYPGISKIELKSIQKLSQEQGGIKLYRNGFRVLPYGDSNDDWLNINRRYTAVSGSKTNIPFANKNLFGFVEIIDQTGVFFEETASREGLLENDAFRELTDFIHKALEAGRDRLRYGIDRKKKELDADQNKSQDTISAEPEKSTIDRLDDLENSVNQILSSNSTGIEAETLKSNTRKIVEDLRLDFERILDELGMTRVLAGLGLTIGEFTHEVIQFTPSIMGDLSVLSGNALNTTGLRSLENLRRTILLFISYTSYFNATVSANVSRELKPQRLDIILNHFRGIIESDLKKLNINFQISLFGYDLLTIPMHSSEWSSILFNLYTNSKKAIKRKGVLGKIKVAVGKEDRRIFIEFSDNGDGIPEKNRTRVFDAFFTTSSPAGFDPTEDEKLTGTGLGLKIVKDIVQTYGGTISIVTPVLDYATCFRIELPLATQKQIKEYGL